MERTLEKIRNFINDVSAFAGKLAGIFSLLLVILICIDVAQRYVFDTSRVWMLELEVYCFACIFLLGAADTFRHDKHVRVDVWYSQCSTLRKAWIDLFGGIFFLLVWVVISIQVTYYYARISWEMSERSAQPNGLPALFVMKGLVLICFLLLFLQGIASIINAWFVIKRDNSSKPSTN